MTTYSSLKQRIYDKLVSIENSSSEPIFSIVYGYPKIDGEGFPIAYFIPEQGESGYETNSSDQRVYAFSIHIIQPTESDGTITEEAIDTLYDAVDYVLDSFAIDKDLDIPTPISLPTGKSLQGVEPVSAGWSQIADQNLLDAVVNLRILISVSN